MRAGDCVLQASARQAGRGPANGSLARPCYASSVRALVCEGPGAPALRDVPVPEPGPGEVLVRVAAALTCGTDLKIARRGHPKIPFPLTLGHEWAGVVEKAGAGAAWTSGTRVTSAVSAPCGACAACREGRENLCATAFDRPLFGAFADFLLVPERLAKNGLRRIPDGMADETAALLDPLASVVRGLNRVPDARGEDVLIAGTGPIAALLFFLLRGKENSKSAAGRRIVVAGRRAERLGFFLERGWRALRASGPRRAIAAPARRRPYSPSKKSPLLFLPFHLSPRHRHDRRSRRHRGAAGARRRRRDGASLRRSARGGARRDRRARGALPGGLDRGLVPLHAARGGRGARRCSRGGAIPAADIVSARRPLAEWQAAFDLARAGTALKVAVIP